MAVSLRHLALWPKKETVDRLEVEVSLNNRSFEENLNDQNNISMGKEQTEVIGEGKDDAEETGTSIQNHQCVKRTS